MGAAHVHGHAGARHRRRLQAVLLLVAGFLLVEVVAALVSGSLALLADAGHMAADVVALAAALVATRVAARPDTSGRRSYGYYRSEVFAAGFTSLLMLGVAAYVVVEAIGRIGQPPAVADGLMIVVGALGLVVNVVSLVMLRHGASESLNVRGAYAEVLGDAAGSVGVLVAGLLVLATGQAVWDTLLALAIGAFVAVRAVRLAREVLAVLGQHVPAELDPERVQADLAAVPGVVDVHDLHLWTLTSGMNVATAHLRASPAGDFHAVLDQARRVLQVEHGIMHATLQVEPVDHTGCAEVGW